LKLKPIAESGIREAAFLQVQILTTIFGRVFFAVLTKCTSIHREKKTIKNKDNFDSHLDSHHDKIFGLHALRINGPDQILAHQEIIMQDLFRKCNNEEEP